MTSDELGGGVTSELMQHMRNSISVLVSDVRGTLVISSKEVIRETVGLDLSLELFEQACTTLSFLARADTLAVIIMEMLEAKEKSIDREELVKILNDAAENALTMQKELNSRASNVVHLAQRKIN